MKNLLLKFAFWVLKHYQVNYFVYPMEGNQIRINELVDQIEQKFPEHSGEFKRAQVMRASMNCLPDMTEREIALAIELAIQRDKHNV